MSQLENPVKSPCFPIFDNLRFIKFQTAPTFLPDFSKEDFKYTQAFLLSYQGNQATFLTYRREIERLLQWSYRILQKSIHDIKRTDIEAYITFCQKPPATWIGSKKVSRFLEKNGQRLPHPEWRPFVFTHEPQSSTPSSKGYTLAPKSLREIFTVIGTFYQFLIQEDYATFNPILQIRQKNRYFTQHSNRVRRLSELQWQYVIETAEEMAERTPAHERTLFIMTILYSLYLRISELVAHERWTPTMGDFYCDSDGLWWFTTVGKGNKERQIAVSDSLLKALKRYRVALGLKPLPSSKDSIPLISKQRGLGAITSTSQIRVIVQRCFDQARNCLIKDGFLEEADGLLEATVHWLRHTGISEDVKYRPREHVRDDAGHSSSVTTDRYINIERRARHASSKQKRIKPL